LTDGLNHLLVLINTCSENLNLGMRFSPWLYVGWSPRDYQLSDPLTGEPYRPRGLTLGIRIGPHSTRLVYFRKIVEPEEVNVELTRFRGTLSTLESLEADTDYHHVMLSRAEVFLASEAYSKAMACILRGASTLGLKARAISASPGRNITLWAMPYDAHGREIAGAGIRCEWIPCPTFSRRLNQIGGLGYFAEVPLDARPREYDYENQEYVSYTGPVKALFRLQHEGRSASQFVTWEFPDPVPIPD
jgi:hypothetical protein